jgi:predicted nucleotidyltransferase
MYTNVTKELVLQTLGLQDSDVLNIFPYGSMVYGTQSYSSDYDFIVVTNGDPQANLQRAGTENLNISLYERETFASAVNDHQVSALESIFLPSHIVLANKESYRFKLDKKLLRENFSAKASNSWVKAKKKFEVVQDRNVYTAKKSLFHCLRIIDFGIQIAEHGKIVNYASSNAIWRDIEHDKTDTWDPYKVRYQAYYNEQMTRFRKLAPK